MVRAKFKVEHVKHYEDVSEVRLTPVYDEDPESENGKFFKYTPGGEIEMHVVNPETANLFEPGKEYYIDFTPASDQS